MWIGHDNAEHDMSSGHDTSHLYIVLDVFLPIQVLTIALTGSYLYLYFVDRSEKQGLGRSVWDGWKR